MAILGLLEERDLHGYEIRRQLRDNLGILANVSFGSIYPALTRLEKAGAVMATEGQGPPDHRRRPRRPPPVRSAASWPCCGPAATPLPLAPGQEGLPDHREGPAALRRAAGRGRLARRRPQLRAPSGLRPAPGSPGPALPAGAPPGPAGPAPGRSRGTNRTRRLRPLGRAAHGRQRGPGHQLARPADRQRTRHTPIGPHRTHL
jgi:hypothetical protein